MKYAAILVIALFVGAIAPEPGHTVPHTSDPHNLANHTANPYECQVHEFSHEEIKHVLNSINQKRNDFAGGKIHTGLQEASDMLELRWDPHIAKMAYDWAKHCPHQTSPPHRHEAHDDTTDVKQWVVAIHNCQAFTKHEFDKILDHIATDLKNASATAVKLNPTYHAPAAGTKRSSIDRALTLTLWASTGFIGCAYANHHVNHTDRYSQIIVCHFLNGGNVPNKPLYTPGKPCTNCGKYTCSKTYPFLCEHDLKHEHNDTIPPPVKTECKTHNFNDSAKHNFVDKLNKERAAVAHGNYSKIVHPGFTGFPAASDMKVLVWDAEFEKSAAKVASNCKSSNDSDQNLHYMELFFGMGANNEIVNPQWEKATDSWFQGRDKVTDALMKSFQVGAADREGKSYLQLIWANAEKIGCAYGNLKDEWKSAITNVTRPLYRQTVICHIEKTSNHVNQTAYHFGPQCTNCPSGFKCSTIYPGLCGR